MLFFPWVNSKWINSSIFAVVVVPTLAAEVNCIGGNYCLILPKAELLCDCGVLFLVAFPPLSSLCPCGWYPCTSHSSQRVPLPLGIHSEAQRELLQFFAPLGLLTRCPGCGRSLQWPQGSQHTLFHAGHSGQAADSNNFWLGLHRHMWKVLIQIIVYSTLPYPLDRFPRSWSCLPCLSAKKVFCLFGNWGRRARVADM